MSFRARLFAALLLAVAAPLALLALGVRREMTARLTADDARRTGALVAVMHEALAADDARLRARLATLAARAADDNRLRAALQGDAGERRHLLDWASDAEELTGLAYLRLQDTGGTVLSSGHFRNEYERVEPISPFPRGAPAGPVLVRARTADRPILALARADSTRIAGHLVLLSGGSAFDSATLARTGGDGDLTVALALPDSALRPDGARAVAEVPLPFVDLTRPSPALATARLLVRQSPGALDALRRSVDRWALIALLASGAVAVLAAGWLAERMSRPIRELAKKTAALDLDRLDVSFGTERRDELGALSRLLDAMTGRLRQSAARLRDAERRATVGDVARQVNHDIKNGLTPIRHVLRHLAQVARDEPAALPAVFEERRPTLEASVEYLDTLARNYAKLSPRLDREPSDLNAVAVAVVRDAASRAPVAAVLAERLPRVSGDEVVLRRIVENLVSNAVDALDGRPGAGVTVRTEPAGTADAPAVRLLVADAGRGMSRAELERAFDDFYTTKPDGTGLGLSIVRRLVQDLGGSLRVETAPGAGSTFTVELPGIPERSAP
jgi:signal transduction histidine kinase